MTKRGCDRCYTFQLVGEKTMIKREKGNTVDILNFSNMFNIDYLPQIVSFTITDFT